MKCIDRTSVNLVLIGNISDLGVFVAGCRASLKSLRLFGMEELRLCSSLRLLHRSDVPFLLPAHTPD